MTNVKALFAWWWPSESPAEYQRRQQAFALTAILAAIAAVILIFRAGFAIAVNLPLVIPVLLFNVPMLLWQLLAPGRALEVARLIIFSLVALTPLVSIPMQGIAPFGLMAFYMLACRLIFPRRVGWLLGVVISLNYALGLGHLNQAEQALAVRFFGSAWIAMVVLDTYLVHLARSEQTRLLAVAWRTMWVFVVVHSLFLFEQWLYHGAGQIWINVFVLGMLPLWWGMCRFFNVQRAAMVFCFLLLLLHALAINATGLLSLSFMMSTLVVGFALLHGRWRLLYLCGVFWLITHALNMTVDGEYHDLLLRFGISLLVMASVMMLLFEGRWQRDSASGMLSQLMQPAALGLWGLYWLVGVALVSLLLLPLVLQQDLNQATQLHSIGSYLVLYLLMVVLAWVAWLLTQDQLHQRRLLAATAQAEQARHSKQQFLTTMSHEMRTPLNGIVGLMYLLNNTNAETDKQRAQFDILKSASQRLHQLVEDVLDLSRIERGAVNLHPQWQDLAALLETNLAHVRALPEASGVNFDADIALPANTMAMVDDIRFSQVLENLLRFALQRSGNGAVALSVAPDSQGIVLRIAHIGAALTPEQIAQTFDAIARQQSNRAKALGGISLSLALDVLHLMQGQIEVFRQGEANVLQVTLPLALQFSPQS